MHAFQLFCLVFWCLCAVAWASNREPCRSPSKVSGMLHVSSTKDDTVVWGDFNYDSTHKKLRFVEESSHSNKSIDVLIHFGEGVMYELDTKNESCKKQSLKSHEHPIELPGDVTHVKEVYLGSTEKSEQGLRLRMWTGKVVEHHAHYTFMTTSCGCLTVSCAYHSEKNDLIFSFFNVETEVEDPQVFSPPDYCDNVSLEKVSDDHSFFDLFHD
ncbi:ependymin [Trichomycterus rosablanca]|uniref:ependymin n=1 Tax=Trichomycterus rosablanca TaxID=2290929 RepID=UPI002F35219D